MIVLPNGERAYATEELIVVEPKTATDLTIIEGRRVLSKDDYFKE